MTTKEVIKILPLDDTLKIQILNMFDFLDPDQRLAVERLAWNTYHALYEQRLEANLALQDVEVLNGESTYKDFYQRALQKTEEEMQHDMSEDKNKYDLSAARQAIEQIMGEIRASKKNAHPPKKQMPKNNN